jgi:acyl-CoA synthetase (AMP-forming)/AMP-acid ligase II
VTETTTALVVPDLLVQRAAGDPDGVAFNVDGGAQLRYADWEARSRAAAHTLRDAGVGRGQRVALLFGGLDWIDYAIAYLAVQRTGATAVHLNDGLSRPEIDRRMIECGVSRVIHCERLAPPAGFDGPAATLSMLDRGDSAPLTVSIDPDDIADVHYTSGTTGPAKGYTVPHANLTFGRNPLAFRDADRGGMLVPMPLGTGTSATCTNFALVSPLTSVVCLPGDVERMAQLIQDRAIGSVAVTPWIASQMIAARIHERYDLASVHMVGCGSAPLPSPLALALLQIFPSARVTSACSQSEAGPALVVNVFDPAKPLSVGRPTPITELLIVDPAGDPAPQGELGEIWLRHPAPKRLYLDPERNTGILGDGWYRTGDYGRIGADDNLYFFDRGVDLIRTAAGTVSTVEVEAVLYEHPAVREAAVFGVPGDSPIPEVMAAVALTDSGDLSDVRTFLTHRLAQHQMPSRFLVLPTLPRNQTGKVLKGELRERAADGWHDIPLAAYAGGSPFDLAGSRL